MISTHERYMRRALDLACLSDGQTSPNPVVGALIVKDDEVIGEGHHRFAGSAHAEVEAIRQVGDQTRSATLYVTLEPCNHHGRTPPCTEAIIEAGLSRVIYAMPDPNRDVTGGGAARLRAAGIEVVSGILEAEARFANRSFIHHIETGRPWVIAKYAATLDGRIATTTGQSKWITGAEARARAHELRSMVDGVAVGVETVIADDPQLTVRHPNGSAPGTVQKHPARIVFDSRGRAPKTARVFEPNEKSAAYAVGTDRLDPALGSHLDHLGVNVIRVPANGSGRTDLSKSLIELGRRGIQRLMVEGGSELLGSFLQEGLIDEAWVFLSPTLIGGRNAKPAIGGSGIEQLSQRLKLDWIEIERLGNDILIRGIRANWH
jgi:diaminohydroxyphosphoribosylaminopyrimidine deaminase/5-amino-6-(5-phosphoribosylamino)uracil reductase